MLTWFRRSFFRSLFMYYIIAGVLLILLTSFMILTFSSNLVQSDVQKQALSGVVTVSENLDDLLAHCRETIFELAENRTVVDYLMRPDHATRYEVARILHLSGRNINEGISTHIVRLADGEIVSTAEPSAIFQKSNYNEIYTLFKRILSTDDVALYTTVKGILMQPDTRIILALAMRDAQNMPCGYVITEVSRNALESIASGYVSVSGNTLMVVDAYNVVLYHSAGSDNEGLSKLDYDANFSQIWTTDAASGTWPTANLPWAKASYTSYAVVSEVSTALLHAMRTSTSLAILPVFLSACITGILFAYIVAKTMSSPLRRLTLAMGEIEKGNFQAPVPITRHDELGRLSEAFNHMQRQIEDLLAHNEEKQRTLRIAEINALSLQVTPHFLYNTLDLIKWCIRLDRPDDANNVIVQLARLLRRLMNNEADIVQVADEMALVESYLEIQKYRHGDKLEVRLDIDETVNQVCIPKLVLQPLIENAIVHGFDESSFGGILQIIARRTGEYLCFVVSDNGAGMSTEKLLSVQRFPVDGMYSIGLSNVNQRAQLYGDASCGITIESAEGKGTTITLILKGLSKP